MGADGDHYECKNPDHTHMEKRVDSLENGHRFLSDQITKNTALTEEVKKDTSEIVAIFKSMQTLGAVVIILGKVAKWITVVSAAGLVIWALVYGLIHGLPPPPTEHR